MCDYSTAYLNFICSISLVDLFKSDTFDSTATILPKYTSATLIAIFNEVL